MKRRQNNREIILKNANYTHVKNVPDTVFRKYHEYLQLQWDLQEIKEI